MTVQDLLTQASQLSVPEQIHLATQLLQLVEQQVTPTPTPSNKAPGTETPNSDRGSINYLMANPIPVSNFKPLTRDEIYDRN
jgi:hypothetical protein